MLPTGHIAGGYLTGYALLKFAKPLLTPLQQTQLLWWATFFGFAPDIDEFWFFFKNKTFLVSPKVDKYHREYLSHAPVLWLVTGLVIYFLASSLYIKYIGLLLWLGSWSHFLLDSLEYGVMWFWPFSEKLYALRSFQSHFSIEDKSFFGHTFKFLKAYATKTISFYFELLIITAALIIYFR